MTDRELLELAAKAAGIHLEWDGHPDQWQPMCYAGKTYHAWNPLTDDGDRYRLARKMNMYVDFLAQTVVCGNVIVHWPDVEPDEEHAIVRAAAEIGKGMK